MEEITSHPAYESIYHRWLVVYRATTRDQAAAERKAHQAAAEYVSRQVQVYEGRRPVGPREGYMQ